MAIRVLIADDQEIVRAVLVMLHDAQPDIQVVGQAADGLDPGRQSVAREVTRVLAYLLRRRDTHPRELEPVVGDQVVEGGLADVAGADLSYANDSLR